MVILQKQRVRVCDITNKPPEEAELQPRWSKVGPGPAASAWPCWCEFSGPYPQGLWLSTHAGHCGKTTHLPYLTASVDQGSGAWSWALPCGRASLQSLLLGGKTKSLMDVRLRPSMSSCQWGTFLRCWRLPPFLHTAFSRVRELILQGLKKVSCTLTLSSLLRWSHWSYNIRVMTSWSYNLT